MGYEVISLYDLLGIKQDGRELENDSVIITLPNLQNWPRRIHELERSIGDSKL